MKDKTKPKLINPKVIFLLFVVLATSENILDQVYHPSDKIILVVEFLFILFLIYFIIKSLWNKKNILADGFEGLFIKKQYSFYDVMPFFLGMQSVFFLYDQFQLGFPYYPLTALLVVALFVILITNAVRGGTKLL